MLQQTANLGRGGKPMKKTKRIEGVDWRGTNNVQPDGSVPRKKPSKAAQSAGAKAGAKAKKDKA